jgi:hypothetical protein
MLKPGDEIRGRIFGVRFEERNYQRGYILLVLLTQDDGHWFEFGDRGYGSRSFCTAWLEDLNSVLRLAEEKLASCPSDLSGHGKIFPGHLDKPES